MSRLIVALVVVAVAAVPAWACPVCGTGTGQQVRAGLADDLLGVSVLAIALPFFGLLGTVGLLHVLPRRTKRHDKP